MLNFEYKGISAGKYVEGEIEALNNSEAAYKLKEQKVIITKLIQAKKKKEVKEKKKSGGFSFGKGVKAQDILIFAKQFSTMLRAGLPVLNALNLLIDQTISPNMKAVIEKIKKDLESGNALSKCFENHPKVFDIVTVNLIKAGEASGKLDTFLERIVLSLEKREKIKSQIKSALFYPGVLFSVAILVTIFMLIKVVPVFVKMYEGMGVEIPGPTAAIMSASAFMRSFSGGGLTLIFIVSFIFGFRYLVKTNYKVRKAWHASVLKLPLFGNLIFKSTFSRLTLVMANLMKAGVPIINVLEIGTNVSTNLPIKDALSNVKKDVLTGKELSVLFRRDNLFPPELAQLISVGEKTGNVDEMLNSLASYYEEEFDLAVGALSAAIEPLMIVLVGGIVAALLLGMYLPIFNAGALFAG